MKVRHLIPKIASGLTLAAIIGGTIAYEFNRNRDWAKILVVPGDQDSFYSNIDGEKELTIKIGESVDAVPASYDADLLIKERLYVNGNLKWEYDLGSDGKPIRYIQHLHAKNTQILDLPIGKNTIRYETEDTLGNINSVEAHVYVSE